MTIHDMLIWGGTVLAAVGLAGILWCLVTVARARARRAGLADPALRAIMQRVVAVNMGALAASMLGLMAVVLGVMLR